MCLCPCLPSSNYNKDFLGSVVVQCCFWTVFFSSKYFIGKHAQLVRIEKQGSNWDLCMTEDEKRFLLSCMCLFPNFWHWDGNICNLNTTEKEKTCPFTFVALHPFFTWLTPETFVLIQFCSFALKKRNQFTCLAWWMTLLYLTSTLVACRWPSFISVIELCQQYKKISGWKKDGKKSN